MPESGLSGSVRGVPSNGHPYREPAPTPAVHPDRPEREVCAGLPPFQGNSVPRAAGPAALTVHLR